MTLELKSLDKMVKLCIPCATIKELDKMNSVCPREMPVPEAFCTPECSRWQSINAGTPVPYWIQTSNWNAWRTYYPNITETDPYVLFQAAEFLWSQYYKGANTLFVRTQNYADARLVLRFVEGVGDRNQVADNTCFCDEDGEVCILQGNHSAAFTTGDGAMNMNWYYAASIKDRTTNDTVTTVIAHELGHALGMAHTTAQGLEDGTKSIMGIRDDFSAPYIYEFDRQALHQRYPVNCTLTTNFSQDDNGQMYKIPSSNHCAQCLGADL